jgi:hypothetical protein
MDYSLRERKLIETELELLEELKYVPVPVEWFVAKNAMNRFKVKDHREVRARDILIIRDAPGVKGLVNEVIRPYGVAKRSTRINGLVWDVFLDHFISEYMPWWRNPEVTPLNKRTGKTIYLGRHLIAIFNNYTHCYFLNARTKRYVEDMKKLSHWQRHVLLTGCPDTHVEWVNWQERVREKRGDDARMMERTLWMHDY